MNNTISGSFYFLFSSQKIESNQISKSTASATTGDYLSVRLYHTVFPRVIFAKTFYTTEKLLLCLTIDLLLNNKLLILYLIIFIMLLYIYDRM